MTLDKATMKRYFQVFFTLLLQAAFFFFAANTLDVPRGWLYFGISLLFLLGNATVLSKFAPDVVRARGEIKQMRSWDLVIGVVYMICLLLTPVMAGLDVGRFHWSVLGTEYELFGILIYTIGEGLAMWSMMVNPFFECTVRIQKDRGQKVIATGPYAFIRHPGYVGIALISLAPPLIIGSGYAFIPAFGVVVALIGRTYFEDRTLNDELDGYKEYSKKVKFRLIPGIW